VDEFLEKLQEDQRRMRRYLRAHGAPFKQMGEALAAARTKRSRVFVVGEPPLDALISLLAEDYLTHLPALPVDLSRPATPSVDPDDSAEVQTGRTAAAKQVGRHLHPGDVVLAFLMDGADRDTRIILEAARAKRVTVLVIGGLGAKGAVRRLASVRLSLPTHGVKTIVESVFICARILARVSRAASRGAAEPAAEEEHLVQVGCDTCQERVFHEQRMRGREVPCPLCQAPMKVPRDSVRRGASEGPLAAPEPGQQKRRRLKPSVLEVKAAKLEELPSDPEDAVEVEANEAEAAESPPSRSPRSGSHSRPSRSDVRSDVGKAIPRGTEATRSPGRTPRPAPTPAPESGPVPSVGREAAREEAPRPALADAPVGLTSHEQPHGHEPSFGSDIMVGSDVVSALPPSGRRETVMATTASADPFALEDAFLADLEMPDDNRKSASGQSDSGEVSRRLSARFTIAECRMRWGRGGFPDESGPTHEMISLSPTRLEFFLDPDDEAGSTLQKGDELWLRLEIPAFIEPVMAQGILIGISGTSGDGRRGTRVELEFQDLDPVVRRKLARASESMGAPA
jgi:hypothetical protein